MTTSEWVVLGVLAALASVFCYGLGGAIVDGFIRVELRNKLADYRRWGLEKQVFPVGTWWLLAGWVFFLGICSLFFSYLFLIAVGVLVSRSSGIVVQEDPFQFAALALVSVFISSILIRSYRVNRLVMKVQVLEDLPSYFLNRLSASEIAATYDGLMHAPKIVWEEFAGLTGSQLDRNTGRKYRELASLYLSANSLSQVRRGVALAVLAVAIALIALLLEVRADLPFDIPFLWDRGAEMDS